MKRNLFLFIVLLSCISQIGVAGNARGNSAKSLSLTSPLILDFCLNCSSQKKASAKELASFKDLYDSFYTLELQLSGLKIYRSFVDASKVWNRQYNAYAISPNFPITSSDILKYPIPIPESAKLLSEDDVPVKNDLEFEWWYDNRYLYLSGDVKNKDNKSLFESFVIDTKPLKSNFSQISIHSYSNESILSVFLMHNNSVVLQEDICGEQRTAIQVPEGTPIDRIYLVGSETTINKIIIE